MKAAQTFLTMSSESIYDLIPKPEEQKEKGPRYVSKYSPDIPPTSSTFGQSHAAQHVVTNASGSNHPDITNVV